MSKHQKPSEGSEMKPVISSETDFFPKSELKRLNLRTWILSYAKRGGVGAEFGVFRGHFAEKIAETINPSRLYLVDPWTTRGEKFNWGNDDQYTNFNELTTRQAREDCIQRMSKFIETGMVEVFEMDDYEFIDILIKKNTKLDFVYLDTSHSYTSTLSELKQINQILKEDGVIMGDDWAPCQNHNHHGLFRAVQDFIKLHEYEIVAAGPAGQFCIRRSKLKIEA